MYARHEEHIGLIAASPQQVFDRLDDQTKLSSHMSERSWKLGWGKIETVVDEQGGRAVGSHIRIHGRVFGLRLLLDEVVTSRQPPHLKTWETVGEPRLLVIGAYRMGFHLRCEGLDASQLRVEIDYNLPDRGYAAWLGKVCGRSYAKWCTRQMVVDAQHAFSAK